MADGSSVTIQEEPVLVDESLILKPRIMTTEPPASTFPSLYFSPTRKSIIFNIETLGLNPWEKRIITIGFQDAQEPNAWPSIIMMDDEKEMIQAFLQIINDNGYNDLIGYNIDFDYRFIILRAMYYGLNIKEFYKCTWYDLIEYMAKGTTQYVYSTQKAPSLSVISDFFFGFPKEITDTEMMEAYMTGDFDAVYTFASNQITRTLMLYYLFRKTIEYSSMTASSEVVQPLGSQLTTPNAYASSASTTLEQFSSGVWTASCPVCLNQWPVSNTQSSAACPICKMTVEKK